MTDDVEETAEDAIQIAQRALAKVVELERRANEVEEEIDQLRSEIEALDQAADQEGSGDD